MSVSPERKSIQFEFEDCSESEEKDIEQTFSDLSQLQRAMRCKCNPPSILAKVKPTDPINTKYLLKVKCQTCGKSVSIDHDSKPIP